MREVKVYLRREVLESVVRALHDAGIAYMAVNEVRSFGSGVDPQHWRLSMDAGEQYTKHAKLEFMCEEGEVDRLVDIVCTKARTGEPGDGVIVVSTVERAIRIRTGAEGRDALR